MNENRNVHSGTPVHYVNGRSLASPTNGLNNVRRYGQILASASNYPVKSNTVYSPISSTPMNNISSNALNRRYSKENLKPVTRMINGKPVTVYTA